jgi:hypothetical protein
MERLTMRSESRLAKGSKSPGLFIGQDRSGRWIVQDPQGACIGLFADRTEAIRFAMFERQRTPQSVIMAAGGLELGVAPDVVALEYRTTRRTE